MKSSAPISTDGFPTRLERAMRDHPNCPPSTYGLHTWLARELEAQTGTRIASETVRKWLAGRVFPRQPKLAAIAQVLMVTPEWLAYGVDDGRPEAKADSEVPPAVAFVEALIALNGGQTARPDPADRDADLMGIRNGRAMRVRIVALTEDAETHRLTQVAPARPFGPVSRVVGLLPSPPRLPVLLDLSGWDGESELTLQRAGAVSADGKNFQRTLDPLG